MQNCPELTHIRAMCLSARHVFEPGIPVATDGHSRSKGTCLYAAFLLHMLLEKFADYSAAVCGGDGGGDGGLQVRYGVWYGHYWVEGVTATGEPFIADITADQFGLDPVVVLSLPNARARYLPGDAAAVKDAVDALAEELAAMGSAWLPRGVNQG